jgi:PAS domain S-box-containing protein
MDALENNLPKTVMFQLVHHADRTFQFTVMGEGYSRMLGFDRAALLAEARLALEQVYEQDIQLLHNAFQLSREQGKPAHFELRVLDKNGALKWLQVSAAPRIKQRALYWDGLFQDITAVKKQLAVLQEEKQNLQNLFEVIDDLLFVCDLEGRILHANLAVQHRLKFALEDLQEKSIFQFVSENRRTGIYGLIARMRTREYAAAELPLTGGSDEIILGELRAYRGQWEQKEVIYLQIRDITEQKIAENSLKESREVLLHIINTIPMSVYWKDTQSIYHGCNETFARTHGLNNTSDVVGKTSFDLTDDDLARDIVDLEQRAIQTNHVLEQTQKPYIREDGSPGRRDISILPLHGDNGLPAGVLGIWRDVTGNSLAQERLKRTLEDMERFNDLLRSRERRTLELKAEINSLLLQNGQEPRYKTTLEDRS